eukprot:SAG22_NODE_96_length_20771_cov_33.186018_20_plen_129_part_00
MLITKFVCVVMTVVDEALEKQKQRVRLNPGPGAVPPMHWLEILQYVFVSRDLSHFVRFILFVAYMISSGVLSGKLEAEAAKPGPEGKKPSIFSQSVLTYAPHVSREPSITHCPHDRDPKRLPTRPTNL